MMCFRDMTFCTAPCKNYECHRMYTKKVVAAAHEWWGGENAPIGIANYEKTCDEFIRKEEADAKE